MHPDGKVIIIGSGLAGLSCAKELEDAGFRPLIVERDSHVGGRVATELVDGFLLDRGFQVIQSAYPEIKRLGLLETLGSKPFMSGAMFRWNGQWMPLLNPLRHASAWPKLARLPHGWMMQLLRVGRMLIPGRRLPQPPPSTIDFLKQNRISDDFIEHFLRPFFGGVFLDPALGTSSQVFLNLLGGFASGQALLPKNGMSALATALSNKLRNTEIRLNTEVNTLRAGKVNLANGDIIKADAIVVATSAPQATRLIPVLSHRASRSITCLYYSVDARMVKVKPILYLGRGDEGPINNLSFNSTVQGSYAPANQHLAAVTVVDPEWQDSPDLEEAVERQLLKWFSYGDWKHLKTYHIAHALPEQKERPPHWKHHRIQALPGVYLCGEHTEYASINGALRSGWETATEIIHGGM